MKNRLMVIFWPLLFVYVNTNGQTTDHSNFLNGLVSAYALESATAVTDELGINHGTVTGATVVPGNLGNALNFTGSQATMATIPTSPSLDLNGTELSFMVDIYPIANGQSGKSTIVQKGYWLTGDNVYAVGYSDNNRIRFRNYINGVRRDFTSTSTAPLNTWSRIICVWKSGEPKVIRINTATNTDNYTFTGTQSVVADRDLTIGSYDIAADAAIRSFTGRIDNVMIWNRALTTSEQNTLINENLGFSDFNAGGSDTEDPTAPTLTSTGQSSSTVDLSWSGATDNVGVTGYTVFQDNAQLQTNITTTNFQVTGLSPSTTYNFKVQAYDAAGNQSSDSNTLAITTDADPGGGGGDPGTSVWTESNAIASYDGKVQVGNITVPGDYKMAIDGKLITEEVRVELSGTWPDYVFSKEYDLPTLEQIQKHIREKGHLPNIPSAQEVEKNGVELGEMNKLLLEKVEELMLYTIRQQEQIEALQVQIKLISLKGK